MPRRPPSSNSGLARPHRLEEDKHMADESHNQRQMLTRWRLVLGKEAEQHGISIGPDDEQARRIEALVGYLFAGGGGRWRWPVAGSPGGTRSGARDECAALGG